MPIDTCGTKTFYDSQPIPKMEINDSQPIIKKNLVDCQPKI